MPAPASSSFSKKALILQFVQQHPVAIAIAGLAGLVSSLLTILIPVSFGKYYELVFEMRAVRAQFLKHLPFFDVATPQAYLRLLLGLIVLKAIFHFVERFSIARLGELFVHDIRDTLYARQLELHTNIYDEKGIGRYLLRYSGDLKSIRNYFTKGTLRFAVDIVLLTLTLVALFFINTGIGWIVCALWLVTTGLVYVLNIPLHKASLQKRNKTSGLLGFINGRFKAMETIKAFNRFEPEMKRFRKRTVRLLGLGIDYQRIYSLIFILVPTLLYLMIAAVLWYVLWQKQQGRGELEEGVLLSVILLLITVLPVFRRILRTPVTWELGNISFQKLLIVLNLPIESPGTENIRKRAYPVELKGLTFTPHHASTPVFSQLDARFELNQINVLDIPLGKPALIKLLLGLYQPDSGKILIGKTNQENISLKSLRRCMAVVSASFPLLGKDVFEAVSYSLDKSRLPKVEEMLAQMQRGLPVNQTLFAKDKIGEFGSRLSASQERILQYVRALLTEKPILVIENPFDNIPPIIISNLVELLHKQTEDGMVIILGDKGEL